MCNQQVRSEIEKAVDTKMINKDMFTAFDVTLEVQKALGTKKKHAEIKRDIHSEAKSCMSTFDYTRKLISASTKSGCKFRTMVYFPKGSDPKDYFLKADAVKTKPTTPAKPAVKSVTRKSRRFNISAKMVKQIGARGKVIAISNGDKVFVGPHKSIPHPMKVADQREYYISKHGNVRIGYDMLEKAGIDPEKATINFSPKNGLVVSD